jgi:predicted nuclease of restriction endonuclease-like RecB superfamily
LGEFLSFKRKSQKYGTQIAKVFETIKLNKKIDA